MEYPKNLGVGRPHDPNFAQEFYRLGLCYQALGKKDLAEQYLTKAAACPHDSRWKDDAKKLLEQLGHTK
jgi:tetratricopeptide (TPR) repeat protein